MKRIALAALFWICAAIPAAAQEGHLGCETGSGGTIKGVAKDAATGAPLAKVGFLLRGSGCMARSISDGTFLFPHVPAGMYTLEVRSLFDYRKGPVVHVTVKENAVSNVEFRVYPANEVLDCLDEPACAAIIKPDLSSLVGLTDAEKMREAVIRTGIAFYHTNRAMAVCVADSSKAVIAAIGKRVLGTVSQTECGMSDPRRPFDGHLVVNATRQPASAYSAARIKIVDANTFDADTQYYTAPLNAATWECRFVRTGTAWIPKSCRMTSIS